MSSDLYTKFRRGCVHCGFLKTRTGAKFWLNPIVALIEPYRLSKMELIETQEIRDPNLRYLKTYTVWI